MANFIKIGDKLYNLDNVEFIQIAQNWAVMQFSGPGGESYNFDREAADALRFYFESIKTPDILIFWAAEEQKRQLEKQRAEWQKEFEQFCIDHEIPEYSDTLLRFKYFLTISGELVRRPDESAFKDFKATLKENFEKGIEDIAHSYSLNQAEGERFRNYCLDMNIQFPNWSNYNYWYEGLHEKMRPTGVRPGEKPYSNAGRSNNAQ